jgi:hypothetical protein
VVCPLNSSPNSTETTNETQADDLPTPRAPRRPRYSKLLDELIAEGWLAPKPPSAQPSFLDTLAHSEFDEFGFDAVTGRAAFDVEEPRPRRSGLVE